MRTSEFKKYLRGQIKKYGDSQNKSIRLVMAVLTTSLIDLEVYGLLLGRDKPPCLEPFDQADVAYFKHCKRSCLIELWSVTEIRIREIVEERKIRVKGRNAAI